jgi:hypothetical protein
MIMQQNLFPELPIPHLNDVYDRLSNAAKSNEPADFVSKRYGHIKTHEIIKKLLGMGFTYQHGESRGGAHSKHVAFLEHPSAAVEGEGLVITENWSMNVIVTNAHDGTAKYKATLGLIGEDGTQYALGGKWSSVEVRHNVHVAKEAPEATKRLVAEAPKAAAIIDILKGVTLSQKSSNTFAQYAARLRWGKKCPIDPVILLEGCKSNVLFDILTFLQNEILEGGTKTLKGRKTLRYRRPAERIRIMREIWSKAEEIAEG